jgi:hypothetical protein
VPSVPDPSSFEDEIAIAKFQNYKSSCSDQIPEELIQERGATLRSEIHELINSLWSKEELPNRCKESIIVPIYKKGDKTECSNYRRISLLLTQYKILSDILPSRLNSYTDEIIGNHQCAFRRNRSTTEQYFCIRQTLEKRREYSETVHQLFVDFKPTIQLGGKYCTIFAQSLGYP